MDTQKGVKTLKEIIEIYGIEIMKDSGRFKSCIDDLLSGLEYSAEKTILKRASESCAFQSLFAMAEISTNAARRAVEKLKKESRMTQEDAEFTVQCVIAARGGNSNIIEKSEKQKRKKKKQKQKEKMQGQNENNTGTGCILNVKCSLQDLSVEGKPLHKGGVCVFQNKMVFSSDTNAMYKEICYNDVKAVKSCMVGLFFIAIALLDFCVFGYELLAGSEELVYLIFLCLSFVVVYIGYRIFRCQILICVRDNSEIIGYIRKYRLTFTDPINKKQVKFIIRKNKAKNV